MTVLPTALSTLPWYLPVADEVALFEAAYAAQLPVLVAARANCDATSAVLMLLAEKKRYPGLEMSTEAAGSVCV